MAERRCSQVVIQGTQGGIVCSCNCGEYDSVNTRAEAEAWAEKHSRSGRADG